jgi:hypothetical protein
MLFPRKTEVLEIHPRLPEQFGGLTFAYSKDGRLPVVSHTDRGNRTRIISA